MKQNTPEWLEMRKNKIGASDAPVIMEVSPWKTPYQLWEEKLGVRKSPLLTKAMRHGVEMEPIARAEFEKMTGIPVFPEVRFHPEREWMMASLDGVDIEGKYAVEIKCPKSSADHEMAMNGIVPEKYIPQLQHQMEVCGLEMIFYFSFYGSSAKIIEVGRDDTYLCFLVKKESEFWRCIQDFEPPETDHRNDGWSVQY